MPNERERLAIEALEAIQKVFSTKASITAARRLGATARDTAMAEAQMRIDIDKSNMLAEQALAALRKPEPATTARVIAMERVLLDISASARLHFKTHGAYRSPYEHEVIRLEEAGELLSNHATSEYLRGAQEFAERLKAEAYPFGSLGLQAVPVDDIDAALAEMRALEGGDA